MSGLRRAKELSRRSEFASGSGKSVSVIDLQNSFHCIETLSSKLKIAEDELRDKRDVVMLTRNRVEEAEKQVQECQNEKVSILEGRLVLWAKLQRPGILSSWC